MANNRIAQITDTKMRQGEFPPTFHYPSLIQHLFQGWARMGEGERQVFANFLPMRLVTLIEVCSRDWMKMLVDFNGEFTRSAKKVLKETPFDYDTVIGLVGRAITIGDLASRSMSVNTPGRIVSAFEGVEETFSRKLKLAHPRWIEEQGAWPFPPLMAPYDETFGTLQRMFEARHVVTHELPAEQPFAAEDIERFFSATHAFLDAINWTVVELTSGHLAATQTEMTMAAVGEVLHLEDGLDEMLAAISRLEEIDVDKLTKSQDAWDQYADMQSRFHASVVERGSLYPMVQASEKARLLKLRMEELRWWLTRKEGDV